MINRITGTGMIINIIKVKSWFVRVNGMQILLNTTLKGHFKLVLLEVGKKSDIP